MLKSGRSRAVREYIRSVASLGGKARAAKYGKRTLRKWAKLGGRPRKKRKHNQEEPVKSKATADRYGPPG